MANPYKGKAAGTIKTKFGKLGQPEHLAKSSDTANAAQVKRVIGSGDTKVHGGKSSNRADRYARGGRTNNITINMPPAKDKSMGGLPAMGAGSPMVPPMPPKGGPPSPPLPPGMAPPVPGAPMALPPQGPPPMGGGPGGPPGGGMPPPVPGMKRGGRTSFKRGGRLTAGAGSGEGRLQLGRKK